MKTTISVTNLVAAAVIGGAFTVGFLSGPAFAQGPGPFAFAFQYDRAELSNEASARKLVVRLEKDVAKHCNSAGVSRPMNNPAIRKCIDETMNNTVAGMGSSTVAQVYKSRADG